MKMIRGDKRNFLGREYDNSSDGLSISNEDPRYPHPSSIVGIRHNIRNVSTTAGR